ncbi:MAG: hypothetical protein D6813_10915 [Calditrichaeota bacterium]|nr:MAG: hypothetical protein D6813_10915 [Calditrichota bacterium]
MKRIHIIFASFLVASALNCGGVPPTFYYRIDYNLPKNNSDDGVVPVNIGIGYFDAEALYEGDRIVYRQSQYEVQYYYYRRWIAPPKKIVREKVIQQFKNSGKFHQVVAFPTSQPVDYILTAKINAFEEWDEGRDWYGYVSILFQLIDPKTQEITWENEFSSKTKAQKREPVEVVRAISESLKNVIQQAINDIVANMNKNIG